MRIDICLALAVPVVLFSPSPVRAAAYRCVLDNGRISYQQFRCNGESRPMRLNPGSGWTPLRPGERALLKRYRDKALARRRKPSEAPAKPARESRACWRKRKQLEAIRAKLRHGYRLEEADALHRKESNYTDYLRQFCSR